jgi:nicotinamide-nucleotide amidase
MANLNAEVITIGDELNRGEIVDTNSTWLAENLSDRGLHVRWRTSVTDDESDMTHALTVATRRAQLVIVSGGLGPTDDDRTVDVVAGLVGVATVLEEAHHEAMLRHYAELGFAVSASDLRQVRIPAGAAVLTNRRGVAPGFGVTLGATELYFMPGIPREMKPMFLDEVAPRLSGLLSGGPRTVRRMWRVAGRGESYVGQALAGILNGVSDATLHFRIAFPEILVTIVVRRRSEEEALGVLEKLDSELRTRLGDHCYGVGDDSLAQVVSRQLEARAETVALAESSTGGLVARLLTQGAEDAAAYFRAGVTAYTDDLMWSLLSARPQTPAAHSPASREAVAEMAEGVRRLSGATWGGAVSEFEMSSPNTGYAMNIAVAGPGVLEARHLRWPGDREQARLIAGFAVLQLLHRALKAESPDTPQDGAL